MHCRRTAVRSQRLNDCKLAEERIKMDTARIVRDLDAEIARLTSARNLLAGTSNSQATRRVKFGPTKRAKAKPGGHLTAAGRKRLSELMKKRWAERKKKAAAKSK
jgi:hypothetical protein